MSTPTPTAADLQLVVGYDGSLPASRALDGAVALMGGRRGHLTVVYVAHLTSTAMLSADAVAEMETDFDQIEQELRTTVAERLSDTGVHWSFVRRQGQIADELIAVTRQIHAERPDDVLVIVVGSSTRALHRVVGSVPVNLARHSPVPLVVVP